MWLTLSIISLLFNTGMRLMQKAFVSRYPKMNAFRINWLVFSVSLPVIAWIIVENHTVIQHLSGAFWLVLAVVVLGFYPLVNYLYFDVIRHNDLSDVLPLLALTPILTDLFGWFFLDQKPSLTAFIGIMCIFASIYTLHHRKNQTWYAPLQSLATSRAAQAMAVISLTTALAAIGDKFAIERSTTNIYFALNSLGAILILLISDLYFTRKHSPGIQKELTHSSKAKWIMLGGLGITLLANQLIGFAAINAAANTSYTIGIRNLNVVVASLIAIVLYHESVNRYKFISYGLSAIGVVMIAL
jgi:drug/metabolite transporter (DMT)-like permease